MLPLTTLIYLHLLCNALWLVIQVRLVVRPLKLTTRLRILTQEKEENFNGALMFLFQITHSSTKIILILSCYQFHSAMLFFAEEERQSIFCSF